MDFREVVGRMDLSQVAFLGEDTAYRQADGTTVAVRGVFDEDYVRVAAGQAGVESAGPMVFYRLADLPVHPDEDEPEIVIRGVSYRVTETKPDGQGGVECLLHRM